MVYAICVGVRGTARPALVMLSLVCLGWLGPVLYAAEQSNLVANGSFELSQRKAGLPDGWNSAGNPAVKQKLSLDIGRDGQSCAKLECTEFSDNGPDFHAMICQVGKVGVRNGQWYRLSLWAKGQNVKAGGVDVGLVNMRPWTSVGLAEAFSPQAQWERFEFLFRANSDLPPENSRLQFSFKSTGTLWLDDMELVESSEGQQWYPQIATEGVKNFIPNSSFECGKANWGSFTYGLSGWAGNLYRLEGELDGAVAQHGQHSFKISFNPKNMAVAYCDYYEPARQPVRRVLVANHGWFRVKTGEKLALSAFLRGDAEGTVAQMAVNEAPSRLRRQAVTVGTNWQQCQFTFVPNQAFLFIAIGLDLEASKREAGTLWIDCIQLERGEQATVYEPREAVEAFIETAAPGNIFSDPTKGAVIDIWAFNNSDSQQTVRGKLAVTDFFDRTVFETEPRLIVPAGHGARMTLSEVGKNRRGFFRASWVPASSQNPLTPADGEKEKQSLRCAIFEPVTTNPAESPLGFNHAYPYDFLVQSAQRAGIGWWRDWSAKWQTVEPQKGQWDFTVPDVQIQRVLALGGEVEVLLPFPSALWNTSARADEVEKAAGNNSYLRSRLPLAYAPKDWEEFGRYAAEVARHYKMSERQPIATFQILNEPVYTDYALPRKFGYTLQDYIRILEIAYREIKRVDLKLVVVGGISANMESGLTREFVDQGGLRFLDVFDLHLYDTPRPAENYEESFRKLEERMRANGGPKPVWITEWGCYADDDPACIPQSVGDATMNRCRWRSERAATEHIVKFTAVTFAHGLRKIFFHAGTCGTINGPDAGGVLFEYGGAPRKMLPGVAALTKLFGTPEEFVQRIEREGLFAYVFLKKGRAVAVAWCAGGQTRSIKMGPKVLIYDVMGNEISRQTIEVGESPVYVLGEKAEAIVEALGK